MADGNTRRMAIKLDSESSSSYYVVPINPIAFDNKDTADMNAGRTVDGYSFETLAAFDGRTRSLTWEDLPNRSPYSDMVSTLKTYIGQKCQIKLNYLEGTGTQNTTALNVRVVDVQTQWKTGSGSFTSSSYMDYDKVVLIYVPI